LKRSTQNLQLSTTTPADYPIYWHKADMAPRLADFAFGGKADILFARWTRRIWVLLGWRRKRKLAAN
ncbi:MAG: hypothetical protein WB489_18275, partial [Pseudolabrys sp.]